MKMATISQFIRTIECTRCGNGTLYDDTPYNRMKKGIVFYEVACPICGNRDIYNEQFEKTN
jgi:ribosomal protein S27E